MNFIVRKIFSYVVYKVWQSIRIVIIESLAGGLLKLVGENFKMLAVFYRIVVAWISWDYRKDLNLVG